MTTPPTYRNASHEAQARLNFELDLEAHNRMTPPTPQRQPRTRSRIRLVPSQVPGVDWRVAED